MKTIRRICAIVCTVALCSAFFCVPISAADETVNITVIVGEKVTAYPAIITNNGTINMTEPEIIQADNFIEITSWSTTGTSKNLKAKCYVKGLKEGVAIIKPKGTITNQSSIVSTMISNTFYRVTVIGRDFTVSFNANGGSVSQSSKTVEYETTYGTLPVPVKPGYDFAGWYTAASGGTKITESTTFAEEADQTLYAQWTPAQYSVTFDANGGSTPLSSKTVTYGSAYGELPVPVLASHNFLGWYTSVIGGTAVTAETIAEITGNQTLYAHWEFNQSESYTINYISGDINEKGFYTETSVTKNADRNNMDVVIVALFDDAGMIVDMTYMKSNLPAGTTAIFGGKLAGKGSSIRAFVWDGLDSMQPLSLSLEK